MNLGEFSKLRPYVYHLTDIKNVPAIKADGRILSCNRLVEGSTLEEQDRERLTHSRRSEHVQVVVNGLPRYIRDQRPISEKVLARSLTHGWTVDDFLYHLNDRVFTWPTLKRLRIHFSRYAHEKPVIFRFNTADLFELNPHVQFCHLNSGATRCSSHWGGNAPARGADTFLPAPQFAHSRAKVAEVTFPGEMLLPEHYWLSDDPNGPWVMDN